MKKIIISCVAVVVIIIATFFIIKLLGIKTNKFEITTTTKIINTFDGYSLVRENKYFNLYKLSNIDTFKVVIDEVNIIYENNNLSIKDTLINNIKINEYIAKYEEVLVIPFHYIDNVYDGLLIYNLNNNKNYIIDKLDDLYLDISSINLEKNTMDVIFKNVYNKEIIINDTLVNICNAKLGSKSVKKNITYMYDINSNDFSDYEEYSSLTYDSYVNYNKLCS